MSRQDGWPIHVRDRSYRVCERDGRLGSRSEGRRDEKDCHGAEGGHEDGGAGWLVAKRDVFWLGSCFCITVCVASFSGSSLGVGGLLIFTCLSSRGLGLGLTRTYVCIFLQQEGLGIELDGLGAEGEHGEGEGDLGKHIVGVVSFVDFWKINYKSEIKCATK